MLHLYCLRSITPECVIRYGLIFVQHLLELSHFFGWFVFLPSVKPTKKIYSGRRFSSGSIVLNTLYNAELHSRTCGCYYHFIKCVQLWHQPHGVFYSRTWHWTAFIIEVSKRNSLTFAIKEETSVLIRLCDTMWIDKDFNISYRHFCLHIVHHSCCLRMQNTWYSNQKQYV